MLLPRVAANESLYGNKPHSSIFLSRQAQAISINELKKGRDSWFRSSVNSL